MDARQLRDQIATVSSPRLEKIRALLEVEQAGRDEQRAEREREQARLQKWQVRAAVATIVAVIASGIVIYQGFENLYQQQEAAVTQDQDSRFSSISQQLLDVDKTMADHPRLISCFWHVHCNAKPKLTTRETNQARALAIYVVDYYSYLYDQFLLLDLPNVPRSGKFILRKNEKPKDNENWVTWSETIVAGFRNSAMVCHALEKWAGEYEDAFVHAVAITDVCPGLKDPAKSHLRPNRSTIS